VAQGRRLLYGVWFATNDPAPREGFEEALSRLVGSYSEIDPTVIEKSLWLLIGVQPSLSTSIRVLAIDALCLLALGFTASWLAEIFENDEEERLRAAALWGLNRILGEDALPYILQALADPAAEVRKRAIFHCRNLTGEAAKVVLPSLCELAAMEHTEKKYVVEEILGKIREKQAAPIPDRTSY
jgi:HEAT repeat protein